MYSRLIEHALFLSPVHSSAAGDISHLCPPKYLLHFPELNIGGWAFSPWKPLNGFGGVGSFSCHSSKVFQKFSGVLWSVKHILQEGNVSRRRHRPDGNWQQHSKCSKKGNCMSWGETSCHDQHWFKGFSSLFPTRVSRGTVWDLKSTNTKLKRSLNATPPVACF